MASPRRSCGCRLRIKLWASLTTNSSAPASCAPAITAFTSLVSSRRPWAYSASPSIICSQATIPLVPSKSVERKSFIPLPFFHLLSRCERRARTAGGLAHVNANAPARPGRILLLHHLLQRLDSLNAHKIDRAPPKAPAHHTRAQHARHGASQIDQCIELKATHLVVVAQARVRLPEQLAHVGQVVTLQAGNGFQHAPILGNHVARAPTQKLWQHILKALKLLRRDIAQALHRPSALRLLAGDPLAQQMHRLLALLTALIIGRRGQFAPHASVNHDQRKVRRGKRQVAVLQRTAIQQDSLAGTTKTGGSLIENSAAHPRGNPLGMLAEFRHLERSERRSLLANGEGTVSKELTGLDGGHLEGCRRTHPATHRYIALQHRVKAPYRQLHPTQFSRDRQHIARPGWQFGALPLKALG